MRRVSTRQSNMAKSPARSSPAPSTSAARKRPVDPLAGRRILVVDDDRAGIRTVREALLARDYEIIEAYDGAGALARVRDDRPDLVLMDVEMPGLNGVEVCRIIKANPGEDGFGFVPVILMTARGAGGKVEGLELGADDYLVKPFDSPELAARVQSMLRLKALQDELIARNRELDRINRELDQKKKEFEELSRTDALTSLFNRRYFEERFTAEFARSKRYRSPLTCLMIDLDHFKNVNDEHGHPLGDQVLRDVAGIVKDTLRDVDLVARYGGEEIVAILPETGPAEGRHVAERIRAAVEAHTTARSGEEARVTISVGVGTYPVPGIHQAEDLLRAADEALYRAKDAGRNCVRGYEE
jgi:two-component system, cell cycle response regulator